MSDDPSVVELLHYDVPADFDQFDDDAGSETGSDGSPPLVEVEDDEYPLYFSERGGRLYHSNALAPYPLPVDTPEQQRLNVNHTILKCLMGDNYVGPVADVLRDEPLHRKKVLDLCTGSGKWLLEMSEEYPHVDFSGIDIVPIATRYPPRNVEFFMFDVNTTLDWEDETFDLIHARDISLAVHDCEHTIYEAFRLLKPGGLFISVEWDRNPAFHASFDLDPIEDAPASVRFHEAVDLAMLEANGLQSTHLLADTLTTSHTFRNVERRAFHVPIGGWHPNAVLRRMGQAFRVSQARFAQGCKHLLLDKSGLSPGDVDAILNDYLEEIRSVEGLMSTAHAVYATKI
ncbi:S-adenosyl-L-methionine-dependent methyltransferase [Coprinopsis marcescibilis]|uniref:S-adenosyl-L-methionine-dependent methyltransferase n=1 Tax=Coprinopsis marcescibilis TaxID=230819 RepID=A0A5C3L965_COPMA|nr:S-adenosyl-L-methionine-dependent methyltransferase [Coprinopsis marcescibilis]